MPANDQSNLSIVCVKFGEKLSTNVNHVGRNLPIDQILHKSQFTSNNTHNIKSRANCYDKRLDKLSIYLHPSKNCIKYELSIDFHIQYF